MAASAELSEPEDAVGVAQKRQKQQVAVTCSQSTLTRLGNISPSRPSRQTAYQGQPFIAVGVCFSLKEGLGVAVVDTRSQAVLTFRDLCSLLTDDRLALLAKRAAKLPNHRNRKRSVRQLQLEAYRLLARWRKARQQNLTQRGGRTKTGFVHRK